ncbi:MAG: hypothetical protein K2K47_02185, partial [Duncaniella sp.]|nr:hypothetical protein [Duncaniella sp.]
EIARLTSISLTHDGVNQSAIAHKNTDAAQTDNGEDEVELSLPDGRVITSLQGLSNAAARKAMTEYVKAYNLLAANRRQLEQLRARYGSGDHSLSFRILSLEEEVDRQSRQLITLRNEAVRAEMGDKMKSL